MAVRIHLMVARIHPMAGRIHPIAARIHPMVVRIHMLLCPLWLAIPGRCNHFISSCSPSSIFLLQLKVYADQEVIKVKYLDEENDPINISSQEELEEAFKVNEY